MNFARLFTQTSADAYDLIHFRQPQAEGDSFDVPLEHPANWSLDAVEQLADEAATCAIPANLKPIEENTVPSWLWRQSTAKAAGDKETSVRSIFDRVVGAATYQGWKQNLFSNEDSARAFYDEARYMLAQRFIAFEPRKLALLGLNWAYGIDLIEMSTRTECFHHSTQTPSSPSLRPLPQSPLAMDITNSMIDTIVSGKRDRAVLSTWHKITGASAKPSSLLLRFADTEAQWETPAAALSGASINLMYCRHNDGSVNIDALRQAARIAVLLLDLQEEISSPTLALGYVNLAPLLMALALPYDSEAARATTAAISSIITAEAYTVSAELAALRGASCAFADNREASLRALRNHRRATYGEYNDYEKMSVTPAPLALASCPDLALTAAARSGWDLALEQVQIHGLRHTQVTSLHTSFALGSFMECDTNGLLPMRSLTSVETETTVTRTLHPSVNEALVRLGYDQKKIEVLARHVVGVRNLKKAPAINHAALRKLGFTAAALDQVEDYLPQACSLRYAFTPWVIGIAFCRATLKIPSARIEDMRFNLLKHLGFTDADIVKANAWCYGGANLADGKILPMHHAAIFATAESLPAEAHIRMAAAVQGFVSGETDLKLDLPVGTEAERFEKLLLDAWRRGVKSLRVTFDAHLPAEKIRTAPRALQRTTKSRLAPSHYLHAKAPMLPKRQSRSTAHRLGAMAHGKPKARGVAKGH